MDRFAQRRDKLRKGLKASGADALLVTNFVNVTYLTGFTGDDSYLLILDKKQILLTDPRYTQQLSEECPTIELEVRAPGSSMLEVLKRLLKSVKPKRLAIEADSMTVGLRDRVADAAGGELAATSGLVEQLRIIKDKEEIADIRKAVYQAERAFAIVRARLHADQTEREVAADIEHEIRRFGGKGCSFTPIVGVGPRAALPHGRPTDKKIGENDFVLIDWGADSGLYKSDLTRVLGLGKIPPKLERVYRVVLTAQEQAIEAIRPGVPCGEVDAVARGIITQAGFGRQFGHGLGHGIGLDIHESPRLAANQALLLEPGMVVTVEPGIYLPDWGGVRIEDDILVTKDGHETLTSVPKQWEDVHVR